jgi:DNA-binding NtrC family response regulator
LISTQSVSRFPIRPGSSESSCARSAPKPTSAEIADQPPAMIVCANPAWRKLLLQAEMVAPYLQLAAIEGESGAGKQTLARFLHSRSPMAALAFRRFDARQWLVNEVDPSTLAGFIYLDRVDLLAAPTQGQLLGILKALQDNPPGRVVLVASSQTSLRQMACQGLLLPDLAFRLTAVRFTIPPLRQRVEDIPPLAQALLNRICSRYRQPSVSLGPAAMARLLQHTWPGNVRELASVLEASLFESVNGEIRADDLPLLAAPLPHPALPDDPFENLDLDAVITHHVQYVLSLNHNNKLRAARQLGISRSTLYRILADTKPPQP